MLSKKQQPSQKVSLAIQEFNRECAQERFKRPSDSEPRHIKRIQNYDVFMDRLIGSGTFSQVYKGIDNQKEAVVAVKVVELRKIQEMKIHDLFWEELKIIKKLRHPNIVTCLEYFRTVNNCYSIYQYCEGGDLSQLLRQGNLGEKETMRQANKIIRDVFRGLLYLESVNVVHRDIKAANILLCRGRAKLGDFGFATKCNREFKDASIGSPAYMAPEALVNNIYGPKTDVWGFGMLIYEILHGESPFADCESQGQLKKRVQVPISWDHLKASLPSPLKRLILKCLQVDFLQRPNFSQLKNDQYLQKIQREEDLSKPMTKSNHTNETSESDQFPKLTKKAMSMSPEKEIKTQRKEESESNESVLIRGTSQMDISIKKKSSWEHLNEDTAEQEEEETHMAESHWNLDALSPTEELQEQQIEYQGVAFRFVPLKQYENQSELAQWYNLIEVLHNTISRLRISKELRELPSVPGEVVKHISLELLQIARFSNFLLLTSRLQQLLKDSTAMAGVVCETQPSDQDLEAICDALFGSIKATEQVIDKHDIDSTSLSPTKTALKEALYCGNMLILSYRLVSSLLTLKPFQRWIQIYKTKDLYSSQQFFIMLYELQLQRMQQQSQL